MNNLPDDWEYTIFKEVFEYYPKTKHKAGEGLETGKYKFFTSSQVQSKYLNNYVYKLEERTSIDLKLKKLFKELKLDQYE